MIAGPVESFCSTAGIVMFGADGADTGNMQHSENNEALCLGAGRQAVAEKGHVM